MITRRKFLKSLGQATLLGLLAPTALAQLVDPSDPIGIIEKVLKLAYKGKPLLLPEKEYRTLLDALEAQRRYTSEVSPYGFENVFINGIPVYKRPAKMPERIPVLGEVKL